MILTVHVKPGAKQDRIERIDEDTFKVHTRARAEKGRANQAMIDILSQELGIKKTDIEIVRGHTTRIKQVKINGWGV